MYPTCTYTFNSLYEEWWSECGQFVEHLDADAVYCTVCGKPIARLYPHLEPSTPLEGLFA